MLGQHFLVFATPGHKSSEERNNKILLFLNESLFMINISIIYILIESCIFSRLNDLAYNTKSFNLSYDYNRLITND